MHQLVGASGLPPAPAGRGGWRRDSRVLALVLVVAAALIVAAATVLTSVLLSDDTDDAVDTALPGPAESVASSEDATGAAVDPGQPPVVAPVDGLLITTTVLGGDVLDMYEVVTWPDGGPDELVLEVSDLAAASGVAGDFAPSVSDLQVTLDGNPVPASPVEGSTTQWLVESPSSAAPSKLEVRYLLAGALIRSTPSTAGRGLAVIAPLSRNLIESLPVRVETTDDSVLTISCPGGADIDSQLCGRQSEDRWTAEAPAGDPPVVVVQVDLRPLA